MEIIVPVVLTLLSIACTFLATRYGVNLGHKKTIQNIDSKYEKSVHSIEKRNEGIIFLPIYHKQTHREFYDYFITKIKNAKKCIYLTGRGLKMEGEDKELALEFIASLENSLEENKELKIVRVQYGQDAHADWYKEFRKLKLKFGDRLSFYVLKDYNHDTVHVAAIDPDAHNCMAEIMIPSVTLDGNQKKEIAGSAIFINGNPTVARSIQDRIYKTFDAAKQLKTVEDFDNLINKASNSQA